MRLIHNLRCKLYKILSIKLDDIHLKVEIAYYEQYHTIPQVKLVFSFRLLLIIVEFHWYSSVPSQISLPLSTSFFFHQVHYKPYRDDIICTSTVHFSQVALLFQDDFTHQSTTHHLSIVKSIYYKLLLLIPCLICKVQFNSQ